MPENSDSPVNIREPVIRRFVPVNEEPIPNNNNAWTHWKFVAVCNSHEVREMIFSFAKNTKTMTFHMSLCSSGAFVSPWAPNAERGIVKAPKSLQSCEVVQKNDEFACNSGCDGIIVLAHL